MTLLRLFGSAALLLPLLVACAAPDGDGAPEDVAFTDNAITSASAGDELVTTARVNLREGPSTSQDVIFTMPLGAKVKALEPSPKGGFFHVDYNGQEGWAYGAYLKSSGNKAPGADDGADDDQDDDAPPSPAQDQGGAFNGKKYTGVTMLWQGNWDYLTKCDSYSRAKGRVVFFCESNSSRDFVDNGAWIAVPRNYFSSGLCGKSARVCSRSGNCINAKIVEKSVTQGKWEGSKAVLDAMGVSTGFKSCTSSFGTATGVSVQMQ